MKTPLRVLLFAVVVTAFFIYVILYRYDLLGNGSSQKTEGAMSSQEAPPAAPAVPPVASPALPPSVAEALPSAEQLAHGKELFEEKTCVLCHGSTGKADTTMGKAINAADLTTGHFMTNTKNLEPVAYILNVIENGVPGTAMVSFKTQIPSEQDRKDLAVYVHSLSKK